MSLSVTESTSEETTGAVVRADRPRGKIVQFPLDRIHEDVTGSNVSLPHSEDGMEQEFRPIRPRRLYKVFPVEKSYIVTDAANKERLNEAFFKITEATDFDLNSAERSNCFDEWKDLLEILARKADSLTTKHHKILGAMIAATHQSDISDFENHALHVLQEATNVLRRPRVIEQEAKRVIANFLERGFKITLPLATDGLDQADVKSLDDMMDKLLEKSREAL
ncbi:MAG: hypothetical protein KAV87_24755 [Desulfobacteraceae bacterium]|nr:hypothetical protein [Desulfobacteraceae bacterium]